MINPDPEIELIDPFNGAILFEGTVRKPPKDSSILRRALHTYVKFDGIKEPQWERTIFLRVTEQKVQKSLDKSIGVIKVQPKSHTPIFLRPKPRH
ncbi:MAG: hypothetical protein KME18_19100 [Phormidium tanganyikae FI6-MK23]|jgi:hypothetical protein|nr:hypothetical protein [Phormidium tanganyikae FI6-MK23]